MSGSQSQGVDLGKESCLLGHPVGIRDTSASSRIGESRQCQEQANADSSHRGYVLCCDLRWMDKSRVSITQVLISGEIASAYVYCCKQEKPAWQYQYQGSDFCLGACVREFLLGVDWMSRKRTSPKSREADGAPRPHAAAAARQREMADSRVSCRLQCSPESRAGGPA